MFAALAASIAIAHAQVMPSPSPTPSRQALSDAWWTGPLLAPSAGTLPHGHILVEPYLYDVVQYGAYNAHGALKPAPHENAYGSLTYVIYGLTDRFNVGMIPVFGYTAVSNGLNSSGIGMGDWAVLAQYRLTQYRAGSWIPTTSVSVQETFPTGKYDNLGERSSDGQGGGAYATKISLYTQTYFWMPNGRILRARLNFSDTFSSAALVHGASIYGTGSDFSGSAHPGTVLTLDAAMEYSATRKWVLANDFVYTQSGNTRLTSTAGETIDSGESHSFALAPAIEYNWSPDVGIIAGVRIFPSGVNTAASVTPAIAVNYVH
ncbi:MAG: transporter [Candidatus Eremiobacteraeota bacterium]|nr:transporter [Candidatus Eremiobacteraeota bacterium]